MAKVKRKRRARGEQPPRRRRARQNDSAAAGEYASSIEALAAALGRQKSQLYAYWARDAPRPPKTRRGYLVDELRAWIAENIRQQDAEATEARRSDRERLEKAQADEREKKAELIALRLEVERARFVPIDEVKQRDLARIAVVRRGLLDLPKSIARHFQPPVSTEVEVISRRRVHELLQRFADM